MALPIHSKIINKLARETLKPLGVVRKGQSRLWFDDNGWWVTLIEFQPSSWSKGTYLNVGVNWQWYPKDYWTFDLGYREKAFVEFKNEQQFNLQVTNFIDIAKERVLSLREILSHSESAKKYVLDNANESPSDVWTNLDNAMICLHDADHEKSQHYLQYVTVADDDRDWANEVKAFAKSILALPANERANFVQKSVLKSRALKGLPDKSIDF